MTARSHTGWWALILVAVMAAGLVGTAMSFTGALENPVTVSVVSDRAGLVMDPGAKVELDGIQVGRVVGIASSRGGAMLTVDLSRDQVKFIPANVRARIEASTIFGAKFVDLVYPATPVGDRIRTGATISALNVTTEVNTVFENLTAVLAQVQPAKINAVLSAFSDALAGKGQRMGEAIAAARGLTSALAARTDTIASDLESAAAASDAYAGSAHDLVSSMSSLSTTSSTITAHSRDLDAALLASIGLADSGIELLGQTRDNFVAGVNGVVTTTDLLAKYRPSYTCTLQGAYWYLYDAKGLETNGRTAVADTGVLTFASDPYRYPDNLPIIAAKGGPDGKPGCNGLPRVDQNIPIRYLVTNTGFGTGMDIRPNPGIAHPWLANYFPVTKAIPEPPRIYGEGPPAIGPVPYPGAPPYGAPLFGADGSPLWAAPPPGAPPPPVPGIPNPPPPYGTGPGAPTTASPDPGAPDEGRP